MLVCTHARRDVCCGTHGVPAYNALRRHVAGHAVLALVAQPGRSTGSRRTSSRCREGRCSWDASWAGRRGGGRPRAWPSAGSRSGSTGEDDAAMRAEGPGRGRCGGTKGSVSTVSRTSNSVEHDGPRCRPRPRRADRWRSPSRSATGPLLPASCGKRGGADADPRDDRGRGARGEGRGFVIARSALQAERSFDRDAVSGRIDVEDVLEPVDRESDERAGRPLRRPSGKGERWGLRATQPPGSGAPGRRSPQEPRDERLGEPPESSGSVLSPRWPMLEEQPPLRAARRPGQREPSGESELGAEHRPFPTINVTTVTSAA